METMAAVIREFMPGDETAFRMLNQEWIRRYFVLEPKDEASLLDPRKTILDPGGRIFLAIQNDQPVPAFRHRTPSSSTDDRRSPGIERAQAVSGDKPKANTGDPVV
jgi:hypothetical protein